MTFPHKWHFTLKHNSVLLLKKFKNRFEQEKSPNYTGVPLMCPCELGACTLKKERNFNLQGDNFGIRCPILHSYKCILSRYIIVTIKIGEVDIYNKTSCVA